MTGHFSNSTVTIYGEQMLQGHKYHYVIDSTKERVRVTTYLTKFNDFHIDRLHHAVEFTAHRNNIGQTYLKVYVLHKGRMIEDTLSCFNVGDYFFSGSILSSYSDDTHILEDACFEAVKNFFAFHSNNSGEEVFDPSLKNFGHDQNAGFGYQNNLQFVTMLFPILREATNEELSEWVTILHCPNPEFSITDHMIHKHSNPSAVRLVKPLQLATSMDDLISRAFRSVLIQTEDDKELAKKNLRLFKYGTWNFGTLSLSEVVKMKAADPEVMMSALEAMTTSDNLLDKIAIRETYRFMSHNLPTDAEREEFFNTFFVNDFAQLSESNRGAARYLQQLLGFSHIPKNQRVQVAQRMFEAVLDRFSIEWDMERKRRTFYDKAQDQFDHAYSQIVAAPKATNSYLNYQSAQKMMQELFGFDLNYEYRVSTENPRTRDRWNGVEMLWHGIDSHAKQERSLLELLTVRLPLSFNRWLLDGPKVLTMTPDRKGEWNFRPTSFYSFDTIGFLLLTAANYINKRLSSAGIDLTSANRMAYLLSGAKESQVKEYVAASTTGVENPWLIQAIIDLKLTEETIEQISNLPEDLVYELFLDSDQLTYLRGYYHLPNVGTQSIFNRLKPMMKPNLVITRFRETTAGYDIKAAPMGLLNGSRVESDLFDRLRGF